MRYHQIIYDVSEINEGALRTLKDKASPSLTLDQLAQWYLNKIHEYHLALLRDRPSPLTVCIDLPETYDRQLCRMIRLPLNFWYAELEKVELKDGLLYLIYHKDDVIKDCQHARNTTHFRSGHRPVPPNWTLHGNANRSATEP